LPIIPGHEIMGRVMALGAGMTHLKLGDRVGVPWLGWACGTCKFCQRGSENLCGMARFTGYQIDGGYASETTADARFVFPLPDGYSDEEVGPLMCAGVIGWRALKMAGPASRLGLYGCGAAAHIVAQVAKLQSRVVRRFSPSCDRAMTRRATSHLQWALSGRVGRIMRRRTRSMRRLSLLRVES
jgi:propanol-preferring alcohol dehydrogenase